MNDNDDNVDDVNTGGNAETAGKRLWQNKRSAPLLWAAFHAALFLLLAIFSLCGKHFSINTNLFEILPDSSVIKSAGRADRVLSSRTGRQFVILVQGKGFVEAKSGAESLYEKMLPHCTEAAQKDALFESISFKTSEGDLQEILEFYYGSRFLLLDKGTVGRLNSPEGAKAVAEAALEKAYSGFSMMPMEYIQGDPFFLTEAALKNLIAGISNSSTAMTMNDGVLSAEYQGKSYVMLRGSLTPLGASITNSKSGVKKIYECAAKTKSQAPDIDFIYSGVPFHSYKSSSGAQKEIAIISVFSMIAVVLLLLAVFKTPLPILCSVIAIGLSALTALCAALLIFGQIHILCFVFGTTLIGTCLDYSVHFFIRWKGEARLEDGEAIRRRLFKGLLLSFASTEICYLILAFAPFALLRQIAVFSFAGILSTFLTVVLLYPVIPMPAVRMLPERTIRAVNIAAIKKKRISPVLRKALPPVFAAVLALVAAANCRNLRIENNLRSFYTMGGKILVDEVLSAKVLNHGSGGWYFIVRGASQDELLENEERFCRRLDEEIAKGALSSYTACTQFVPSAASQRESWTACNNLLPLAKEQFRSLGFESGGDLPRALSQFYAEYEAAADAFVRIEPGEQPSASSALPAYARQALSSHWIGQVGGEWFSAVLPLHANDVHSLRRLAEEDGSVFFMNKTEDVERELNRLTKIMLALLALAFAVLAVCLRFFYPVRTVVRIASVPLAVMLAEAAAAAALNIPIGFFFVTGIILVFGLGLDYMIYTVESAEKLNRLALFISFATTELSFGSIALSSFAPVHIFGTAVFAGLLAAFFCTLSHE